MASELVRQLVDAGIHFGHRTSRWNPKMAPYIFGRRNSIHIIDIRETIKGLTRAMKFLAKKVSEGQDILFVGTKRQARVHIVQQSGRVNMPFVTERWLGGTLTNFRTIRSRLGRLDELEAAELDGTAMQYSKKMIASRARELRKIKRNLDGIRNMSRLPGALIIVDVRREKNAVLEAKILKIPTVCLIDTDSDPDFADVPIPGNDDAMRSIEIVLSKLADAIEMGLKGRLAAREEDTASEAPQRRSQRPTTAEDANAGSAATGSPTPEAGTKEAVPPPGAEAAPKTAPEGVSGLTPATASDPEARS